MTTSPARKDKKAASAAFLRLAPGLGRGGAASTPQIAIIARINFNRRLPFTMLSQWYSIEPVVGGQYDRTVPSLSAQSSGEHASGRDDQSRRRRDVARAFALSMTAHCPHAARMQRDEFERALAREGFQTC